MGKNHGKHGTNDRKHRKHYEKHGSKDRTHRKKIYIGNTGKTMGNMGKIGSGKFVGHMGKTMGNIG
jgi:hypothetical protein